MSNKTVWLGKHGDESWYELGTHKKYWSGAGFHMRGSIDGFCVKHFESITGFKLEPGEVCKVKITVERV